VNATQGKHVTETLNEIAQTVREAGLPANARWTKILANELNFAVEVFEDGVEEDVLQANLTCTTEVHEYMKAEIESMAKQAV
jgi:hypothetical protein